MDQENLSLDQLRERIRSVAGAEADSEALDAVAAGFYDSATGTRPLEFGLREPGVVYAWRSEDADIVKAALEFLDGALAAFQGDLKGAGMGLKDILTFWVHLRRSRVRVADPKQVAVLLALRNRSAGMTASELCKSLNAAAGPQTYSVDDVELALDELRKGQSAAGAKQLVVADGQVWKSAV